MFNLLCDRGAVTSSLRSFEPPVWHFVMENLAKRGSERHNKWTCRLVLHAVAFDAKRQVGKL